MKKISDLLKPFLSVIFGALLLLCHFNWLSSEEGGYLALGIIGVILAAYYVAVGLLNTFLGEKLSDKAKCVFDGSVGVALFPLFMGAIWLVELIVKVDYEVAIGPMGWTIALFSIIAGFGVGGLLLFAYFMKNRTVTKLAFLFSSLFVLALILDILVVNGNPATLGSIVVLVVVLYGVYVAMLLSSLSGMKDKLKAPKESPKKEEAKPEETK